jgi:hypothetical protein
MVVVRPWGDEQGGGLLMEAYFLYLGILRGERQGSTTSIPSTVPGASKRVEAKPLWHNYSILLSRH